MLVEELQEAAPGVGDREQLSVGLDELVEQEHAQDRLPLLRIGDIGLPKLVELLERYQPLFSRLLPLRPLRPARQDHPARWRGPRRNDDLHRRALGGADGLGGHRVERLGRHRGRLDDDRDLRPAGPALPGDRAREPGRDQLDHHLLLRRRWTAEGCHPDGEEERPSDLLERHPDSDLRLRQPGLPDLRAAPGEGRRFRQRLRLLSSATTPGGTPAG